MKFDYHMHFEYGDYDLKWVQGFFDAAKKRGLDEIGISEHTHTFPEFEKFYYDDLILDNSEVGEFQKVWLKTNKFKHTLKDYFDFMAELQKNHAVKIGIEVCNFKNQSAVKKILDDWDFDYIIGSVHFLWGWGYDASKIKNEWTRHDLKEIYEEYTREVEKLAESKIYDILGHPFNIRLFKNFPDFEVTEYLERVAVALKKSDMAVDVNTGTKYRYPVEEISPYADFMKVAAAYELPITINSDAHQPEDCGKFHDEAVEYVKTFGYKKISQFTKRKREFVDF
ncbi:MAG: histidinol-phosphatase HisJ family protein [Selenomonadaceae bacterium]|nr:histidinol-phosphatase HisJ family protein [Selenomonadaceae bacterium]